MVYELKTSMSFVKLLNASPVEEKAKSAQRMQISVGFSISQVKKLNINEEIYAL